MENILLLVHLLTALSIIGLILLQQGKGAEMGASFGSGASQTLFGSVGSGNFFSRLTAVAATAFFVTSFSLAVIAKQKTTVNDDFALPELEQLDIPAVTEDSDVPALESDMESIDSAAADEIPALEVESAPALDESEVIEENSTESDSQ